MAEYPTTEERTAARQYLEHDYAAGHLGGEGRRTANAHAQELDEQHPRARDIALTGTDRELGELPKHLKAHQRRSREQAGITTDHAARIRSGYRKGPHEELETAPRRQTGGRREQAAGAGRRFSSAAGDALSTAGGTSWGQLLTTTILWGIGLSIAYLLLTSAEKGGAASGPAKLATGFANATRALVAVKVDPLNPGGVIATHKKGKR